MVQTIAMQCPAAGGPAVYIARALVELFNDSIYYDDKNVCLQAGYYKQAAPEAISSLPDIEIIPNPASETVSFIIKNTTVGVCHIKLVNAVGKIVYENNFNCSEKSYSLNVHNFAPGIYHAEIKVSNTMHKHAKLIIIH